MAFPQPNAQRGNGNLKYYNLYMLNNNLILLIRISKPQNFGRIATKETVTAQARCCLNFKLISSTSSWFNDCSEH